jgi:hypothetical protein
MEEIRASRPALAVAASGGNLLERIRRLLGKDSANENKISWLPSVIVMVLICSMLIPVGLAMSDGTASSKFPSFIIRGTVTDAQTGKPIANAKVGDGEKYNKGKLGAVTGANGKYEYKTWYEEHNITAEAKGYETGRKGLYTKFIGSEKETVIDFKLTPFKSLLVGRYEPGVETAVNLASADKLLDCKSIKFEQSRQGHVSAVMLLEVTSYPKTKWEIEVGLVDGEGKGVKTVSEQFENSGYAIGDPIYSKEVFILDFGKVAGIDKVKSFVVRIYNSSAADNLYLTEYQMNIAGRIFQSLSDELKQIASKYPELAKFQRLNQTASLATPSGDAIRVLDLSYKHNFTAPKGKRKIRSSDFGENGFYFNLKCAPIPPSHVPAYAMSPPTLILRKLGVYLWAEVKTGANPSPGVVEEVQSLLKTQLEKFKKYDNGFTMRTDEKPAQPVKGGPQVVIEAKFIEVYNKFLEDIGFVEPYVYGKPGILNDSQTELLLRIAPERSDSKVLANPKVHVRDNERGSIAIMTEKAYVSGYTEVESAPDKPKAKVEYFDSGIKTDLTPHITEDGKNVRLGFKFIFSDMNAGRAFLYKGRHPYHKPEMLVTDIVTEVVIPDGETFLCEPVQITRYDANLKAVKKTLLILLKPTIILSPDEPAKSSVAVKLGGGGGVVGVDEKVSKAQVSSFTGRYEPGKETAVNLASADNLLSFCRATDKLFYCKSIKFEQSRQGQVKALMQLGVTSFPKKKWQIEVRLLDGAGKQVKAVSEKFENSGVIGRRASHTKEVLALDFGKVADIEKVKNFLIMIRGEKKVSDPSIPAPLISAPLISELQPMAKTKQAVKDGPQVSIETRYISVDEKFFEELGIDLFEKNETTAMLDDLSVRFIIRAMERQPRATMLTAPKVTVWNNEQAKINITKDWRYVSGYKELESAPERPVKKTKEFTSGIKVNVTPNVSEDGRSITLELESKFSNFSLGKIHRYKKRHLYYEPDISVKDIAATATISDGGTLLIDGGPDASFKINDRSHDGHLLIMVKPSILKPRVEVD